MAAHAICLVFPCMDKGVSEPFYQHAAFVQEYLLKDFFNMPTTMVDCSILQRITEKPRSWQLHNQYDHVRQRMPVYLATLLV